MVWHSVNEAVKLTGRSRRSIYRDIATGRVSSELGRDGQRRFETSELMRVYGAFVPMAHQEIPVLAQVGTPLEQPSESMALVLEELRELRQEVKALKEALRLLEYKPDPKPYSVETTKPSKGKPKGSVSWSDLLDSLEAD